MAKTDPLDSDGQRGAIVNMASVAAFDGQTGQMLTRLQRRRCRNDLSDSITSGAARNKDQYNRSLDSSIHQSTEEGEGQTVLKRTIWAKLLYFPRDSGIATNPHQWSLNA